MKAILLAAGKGTRLRPLTDTLPKPMLEIAGKPILEHTILLLKRHGISEVFINLHYLPDVVKNYFGDGSKWDVKITYAYEKELLGTAGAVKNFQRYIGGESFFVLYGDNYTDYDLTKILKFHRSKRGIATVAVFEKEDVLSSGIVELDSDNQIVRLLEKPKPDEIFSHLVIAGIFVCEPEVFDYIPDIGYADFGYDVFPRMLANNKPLYGIVMEGMLEGIDTIELYQRVNKLVSHKKSSDTAGEMRVTI